jgi:uncharacterized membrane protein YgcG
MPKIRLLALCIAFIWLINVFTVAGLARSLDQTLVIDDAQIFANRISEVETAANSLSADGADVRIRTITTYGNAGNLDRYEAQLERQSPSWLGSNGDRKDNLIVLMISLQERQTGIYYGSYWTNVIDDNWLRIQTEIMNPLFRDGDYAGGTIQGLAEIRRLIESKPAGTGTPTVSQTVTQTVSPAAGQSNWWIFLVVIIVIACLVAGLLWYRGYRNNQTRRQTARQKALLAKQAAASGINELLEATQMLDIKVNVTAGKITPGEAAPLTDGLEKAKSLVNQSSQTYSELSHSAGDPENPRLGAAELATIESEYQKILDNLRQAREAKQGVESRIGAVQQAIDSYPARVNEVSAAAEDALQKQAELKSAGFKTDYLAGLVANGLNTLEQAKALVAAKKLGEGMKYVGVAGDQIKQAVDAAARLPQEKQAAETAVPALAARIEKTKEITNNGRDTFDRLSQGYAETAWEPVRGNGTEAENRINWALDAHDDAAAAIGADQQDWHQAMELVSKGNNWLTEVESLMKSITDLEVNLRAAQRAAPQEISAAQADVKLAWDYINRYDEDIRESLEDDLRIAESKNETARMELQQGKPDYFKVVKMAREANESADKILIQARDEHEQAERSRVRAASVRRDADAKVSIASRYVQNHYPVVQPEAKRYLANAVESLRQAEAAPGINDQISLATQAESAADQAYSLAQRDVNSTNMSIPNINIPTILFPGRGQPSGGRPSWGSSRPSGSSSRPATRPGGGGSTGWGAKGGTSSKGGGSTGW